MASTLLPRVLEGRQGQNSVWGCREAADSWFLSWDPSVILTWTMGYPKAV